MPSFLSTRLLIAAALLATASAAHATTILPAYKFTATYGATPTGTSTGATGSAAYAGTNATGGTRGPYYLPTINDDGGGFLSSPNTQTLALGVTSTPTIFLQVAPLNGGSNIGTQTGSIGITLNMTDFGGSTVTGVTATNPGDAVGALSTAIGATVSNGTVKFSANYILFYGNQTDCITWDTTACTASNQKNTSIGETLALTFKDGTVLDVNLYNWSDWDMTPDISFQLVKVPEPATLAMLATGIIGLVAARRRQRKGSRPSA